MSNVCETRTRKQVVVGNPLDLSHESDERRFDIDQYYANEDGEGFEKKVQFRCKHCGSMFMEDPK